MIYGWIMSEATDQATRAAAERQRRDDWQIGGGQYDADTDLFEWYDPIPVGDLIGRNVRRLREERELTQHELAQLWQRNGLNWARSKVSALESGARPTMSVGEIVIIAKAFRVPLRELFRGPERVLIGLVEASCMPVADLEELFGGAPSDGVTLNPDYVSWRKGQQGIPVTRSLQADAELAQRLGRPVGEVVEAAWAVFGGLTLTEERDRRVARMGKLTPDEKRAHRGHITRELSQVIEIQLKGDLDS